MTDHPIPTSRARELVTGAYDTHIHVAPDVMTRRIDDVSLARRFAEVGMAGFVLKSHYVPTAERAQIVRSVVPGVDALGALTLNGSVGGMNPVAVEIAARQGARIVWFPTVDSANQRRSRTKDPDGAKPPMWAQLQDDLASKGILAPEIAIVDEGGRILPAVHDVIAVIAEHDLVLATGHLSQSEIVAVVHAAADAGVRRTIVTHPEFTSQQIPVDVQCELAAAGALLERCFTTAYTGKVTWDLLFEHIRAVGPEHSILSSDLGQPFNPPVEDGLAIMADLLLDAGFSEADVEVMAVQNTRRMSEAAATYSPVGVA